MARQDARQEDVMRTQDMKVVTLEGAPRERGRIMGESLRDDVRALIAKRDAVIAQRSGEDPAHYWAAFDAHVGFGATARQWAPDLVEEVEGLGEGAGIGGDAAMRLQYLDEDWFFDAFHRAPKVREAHKCTTVGVAGHGDMPTLAGQNMDITGFTEGHQVLLRIVDAQTGLTALVFSYAGMIGLTGMNDAPLGVNCNTLMQLGFRDDGLPVAFVVRLLLQQRSFAAAEDLLRQVPHACGQNYVLSAPDRIGSFECGPQGVAEYRPRPDADRVCHTNHPLENTKTRQFRALTGQDPQTVRAGSANSAMRLQSIRDRTMHEGPVDFDNLKAALASTDDPEHPICRELPSGTDRDTATFTAGSLIFEFSENPRMQIAAGPPTLSDYVEHRL